MRENKFRVWCEFEINGKIETSMEEPCSWFLLTQTGKLWTCGPTRPPQSIEKEYKKAIPLFYTGLKDKNGKEIYEGGVVKLSRYWQDHFGRENTNIFFVNGCFEFAHSLVKPFPLYSIADACEVIGNIYENPELMKGE